MLVVCRSWQTPYFWSPEPASWRPLGFNTKQWAVNFQSKVLMETTRKTSCCNANAGSKVWLWQMLNVDGGRGESSLLLLYNSSYNLFHRQTPFPPVAALQPRSLLLPARVDACGLASGSCISVLFSLHHFILNSLYIFSLIDLLAEAAQQPHSQQPPIKRLVGPTLLFGRHPFLYSGFLSCSVYSLWSGKAACCGPGGLIKWSCRVYNPMLTWFYSRMTDYHQ